jgi:hypothetical protein
VPENDGIYRVSLQGGGGFSTTPEPSTLVSATIGLVSIAGFGWLRRRKAGTV